MNLMRSRNFWGIVLLAGGVLFLLQSLGVLKGGDIFWGLLFLVFSGLLLSAFWTNRSQWWFLVPGMLFLGIGAGILSSVFLPQNISNPLEGMLVLGSLGVGFWLIYIFNQTNWWAIIPGGVMISLAVVSALDEIFPSKDTGGVFLIGLGLTFVILAILPRLRMTWAYIPALVLIAIGIIPLAGQFSLINYIWPALLILLGIFVLLRELGPFRR